MLTISQLADYAGVTVRAVRHYHHLGLLPEPQRDQSGYRRYDGQAVVDLIRIKTLAEAGVPLSRVAQLLEAGTEEFSDAVAEIGADLDRRIAELRKVRARLAELPTGDRLWLPEYAAEILDEHRSWGISEETVRMARDGWILLLALRPSPELVAEYHAWAQRMADDPDYRELYLETDAMLNWSEDDPRIEELARRSVEHILTHYPPDYSETEEWGMDPAALGVLVDFEGRATPSLRRFSAAVSRLLAEFGYRDPDEPEPGSDSSDNRCDRRSPP